MIERGEIDSVQRLFKRTQGANFVDGTQWAPAGQCEGDPTAQNSGGGFSFMPLLVGYMMGSMLSRGGGIFSQPMVRTASGGYSTPKGDQTFASNRGTGKVAASTFQRAPSTIGKPPMTASQVSQRGGFGAGATARSGSRSSFGG